MFFLWRNFYVVFYSAGNIKNAEKDAILWSLVDAVESNCVMDRQLVISDLQKHDEAAGEETKFGNVSVHVAMSVGVKSFCIAAGILKDRAELIILWNEMSEHNLDLMSKVAQILEYADKKGMDAIQALDFLKNSICICSK